jgi:hypothetical protein
MMMKRNVLYGGLAVMLALSLVSGIQAYAEDDDARLQAQQKDIDKATPASQQARVDTLAKQFQVPASTVEDLQSKRHGWGQVTIELAMAQELSKTDPKTYPTVADALKRIDTLRDEHIGWGRIAKEQGFKLGPVISDVKHMRQEFAKNEQGEHGAVDNARDHRDKAMERPQRPEHPERPERAERPERPERHGRP